MANRTLKVEIVGDASSLHRAFGQAADSGSRFGGALRGVGKAAAFAVGGAALGGLAVTLKAGFSEFSEGQKVAAQTAAALKSTGGAANVTAKQVDDLAGSIMRYSGIDDEAIKSGENLLLTFTRIRNETGKGNDVFNQATRVVTDMSVALGQDMKSSAIQVGKALNDPIKGITALQRVGVSFTAGQKEQIKALVDSGHAMEAQKVILAELNTEFGGSAKAAGDTLPGQLNKLKETFNNLAGDLVGKAVPALTSFTGFIADKGLPKLEEFFGFISGSAGPAIKGIADAFQAALPAIEGVLQPLIQTIGARLVPIFQSLQAIATEAMQKISAIIQANGPQLRQIFENLGEVISNLAKVVVPVLRFAFAEVLPVAIRVLIPILVAVTEVLSAVSTAVRVLANLITGILVGAFNGAKVAAGGVKAAFDTLQPVMVVVGKAVQVLADLVKTAVTFEFNAWAAAVRGVISVIQALVGYAGGAIKKLADVLAAPLAVVTGAFSALAGAVGAVLSTVRGLLDQADNLAAAADKIAGAISKVGGLVGKAASIIPGRASGGPVKAGQPYVVGETGPELFIPNQSGQIVANAAATGGSALGGSTMVFNFPNYLGSKDDLINEIRVGLFEVARRNPGALPGVA